MPKEWISPLIFGEVLFDVFPGGEEVLGGAPFNVAWNLCGLGVDALLVSRVGKDARGDRVLEAMRSWGMDTRGVQVDPDHPTGIVEVSLEDGQPQFMIVRDQAYDFVDPAVAGSLVAEREASLLYHGTLASRSPVSRRAVEALTTSGRPRRFVDVNLRAPWWDLGAVNARVSGASWVKLNETELAAVCERSALRGEELEVAARDLRRELDLSYLVVTLGESGALLLDRDGNELSSRAPPVDVLMDTVGAGDALSAVMILGLCRGWPPGRSLKRAVEFAASVCGRRGATTSDRSLYEGYLRQWDEEDR